MMHSTPIKTCPSATVVMRGGSKIIYICSVVTLIFTSVVMGTGATSVEKPGIGQTIVKYLHNLINGSSSNEDSSTPVAVDKKTIQKAMMFGSISEDQVYYIDMMIGTPPRRQSLALSTQGSLLTIPCKQGMGHMDKFFNDDMSKSSKKVNCDDSNCYGVCDQQGMCRFNQKYVEGSEVSGIFISDMVALGEISEQNQPIRYDHIGCRTDESGIISKQKVDGVMGMNFPGRNRMPSLLDSLFDKSSVNTKVFSTCMSENGGMLTVGGYDLLYHRTDIEGNHVKWLSYSADANKYVGLMLKTISVSNVNASLAAPTSAIVESGSTFTYFPKNVFSHILRTLKNNCKSTEGCSLQKSMCFSTAYPTKLELYFPTLKIEFENNLNVDFYPRSYMYRTTGDEVCLGVRPSNDGRVVLGLTFFKEKQLIFDIERQMIGMAEAKCPEFIRRPQVPDALESQSSVTDADTELLSTLGKDIVLTARGMESCRSIDHYNLNLHECQRHLRQLEMRMTQCDDPRYFESNPVMCKFVRFVMQTYQGVCITMSRLDQDLCMRVRDFTEELQSKCLDRFLERHRQTCEDNLHYFDIMQAKKCEMQDYYFGHNNLCDNLCESIDHDAEKCSRREYFSRHVQACEFQHAFHNEVNDACQRRNSELVGTLCQRENMCRKLREKKCSDKSFEATHERFCQMVLPADVLMLDRSAVLMPQILKQITQKADGPYPQINGFEMDRTTGELIPMSMDDLGRMRIHIETTADQEVNPMSRMNQDINSMYHMIPGSTMTGRRDTSGMTDYDRMYMNQKSPIKGLMHTKNYDQSLNAMNMDGVDLMRKSMDSMTDNMKSMNKADQMQKSMNKVDPMQKSMDNMVRAGKVMDNESNQMGSMNLMTDNNMRNMNKVEPMQKSMGDMVLAGKVMGNGSHQMGSMNLMTDNNMRNMNKVEPMQKSMGDMVLAGKVMGNGSHQMGSMNLMTDSNMRNMNKVEPMQKSMGDMVLAGKVMGNGSHQMGSMNLMTDYNMRNMNKVEPMQKSMGDMVLAGKVMGSGSHQMGSMNLMTDSNMRNMNKVEPMQKPMGDMVLAGKVMGNGSRQMGSMNLMTDNNMRNMNKAEPMQKPMGDMVLAGKVMDNGSHQMGSMNRMTAYNMRNMNKVEPMQKSMGDMVLAGKVMGNGSHQMGSMNGMTDYNMRNMNKVEPMQKSMGDMVRGDMVMDNNTYDMVGSDKMDNMGRGDQMFMGLMTKYGEMMNGMNQYDQMMKGSTMHADRMIMEGAAKYGMMNPMQHPTVSKGYYYQNSMDMQQPRRNQSGPGN